MPVWGPVDVPYIADHAKRSKLKLNKRNNDRKKKDSMVISDLQRKLLQRPPKLLESTDVLSHARTSSGLTIEAAETERKEPIAKREGATGQKDGKSAISFVVCSVLSVCSVCPALAF